MQGTARQIGQLSGIAAAGGLRTVMKIEEMLARAAIRRTMARYTMAGDRLRADDFAAVFTHDGVMEGEGLNPADNFRHDGQAAIRNWMLRWRENTLAGQLVHQATFVRHHLSTCDIELLGPGVARARTYWTAWTDIGPDHAGFYLDDFRQEGEEWLIARRRIREDWRSPQSLFHGAVTNSSAVPPAAPPAA
jgi:hypothetical protein